MVCWDAEGSWDQPGGPFISVGTGEDHYCAIDVNGSATCWGSNDLGPVEAPGGTFVSINAGDYTTCGIRPDGSLVCWGSYVR